jgi:hypothetical protein
VENTSSETIENDHDLIREIWFLIEYEGDPYS